MKAVIVSDVHICSAHPVRAQRVLSFLQQQAESCSDIVLLGDFFDVWPITSSFLLKEYRPVLESLATLARKGCRIHYFEGNHDFHLGESFSKELGLSVYRNATTKVWNGKRIYLAHGDLGNPKEFGYRILRGVLRSTPIKLALRAIPGSFVHRAGSRVSNASRAYSDNRDSNLTRVKQIYRETAESLFTQGFDAVIMGHTHLPDDVRTDVNGRTCRYLNTGDWVSHFTYVEFDGGEFYTRKHSP